MSVVRYRLSHFFDSSIWFHVWFRVTSDETLRGFGTRSRVRGLGSRGCLLSLSLSPYLSRALAHTSGTAQEHKDQSVMQSVQSPTQGKRNSNLERTKMLLLPVIRARALDLTTSGRR